MLCATCGKTCGGTFLLMTGWMSTGLYVDLLSARFDRYGFALHCV